MFCQRWNEAASSASEVRGDRKGDERGFNTSSVATGGYWWLSGPS